MPRLQTIREDLGCWPSPGYRRSDRRAISMATKLQNPFSSTPSPRQRAQPTPSPSTSLHQSFPTPLTFATECHRDPPFAAHYGPSDTLKGYLCRPTFDAGAVPRTSLSRVGGAPAQPADNRHLPRKRAACYGAAPAVVHVLTTANPRVSMRSVAETEHDVQAGQISTYPKDGRMQRGEAGAGERGRRCVYS